VQLNPHEVPDVYILSAQFGLIHGDEPIPAYDYRMTPQRAHELRDSTAVKLQKLDLDKRYQSICLCAGATYREILSSPVLDTFPRQRFVSLKGGQGVQLSYLKAWLYNSDREFQISEDAALDDTLPVRFTLKGIKYEVTPFMAITVARQALENGLSKHVRATAWYVLVDGQPLPPKWLVSQLTGVPVGDFHTMEARRVLAQLGLTARQA